MSFIEGAKKFGLGVVMVGAAHSLAACDGSQRPTLSSEARTHQIATTTTLGSPVLEKEAALDRISVLIVEGSVKQSSDFERTGILTWWENACVGWVEPHEGKKVYRVTVNPIISRIETLRDRLTQLVYIDNILGPQGQLVFFGSSLHNFSFVQRDSSGADIAGSEIDTRYDLAKISRVGDSEISAKKGRVQLLDTGSTRSLVSANGVPIGRSQIFETGGSEELAARCADLLRL